MEIIESAALPSRLVQVIAAQILTVGSSPNASPESKTACRSLLDALRERHPSIVDVAALAVSDLDSTLVARPDGETAILNALSADVTARVSGIEAIMSAHLGKEVVAENADSLRPTLLARLGDMDPPVLEALYKTPQHCQLILQVCTAAEVVKAIRPAFAATLLNDQVVQQHLAAWIDAELPDVFEQLLFTVVMPTQHRALSDKAWAIVRSSNLAKKNVTVKAIISGDVSSAADVASKIGTSISYSQEKMI